MREDWPLQQTSESDFDYGYRVGFADHILHWWQLAKYSSEFQRGYNKGKSLIDELVDVEAQSRCFG